MKKFLSGIFVVLALFSTAFAQVEDKTKRPEIVELTENEFELFADAEYFFGEGNYYRALVIYLQLAEKYPQEGYFRYKAGICYLNKSDEKEKAIPFLLA